MIIKQENEWTNIYYKLFYMTNERITLWIFFRFNILACFTRRYSGDGIIETEVENGVCLHLMVSKLVRAHNSKWGAGKKPRGRHLQKQEI